MENKKYLNEEKYQQIEKKMLKLSKVFLIVGVCLAVVIILAGVIYTNKKQSSIINEIEKVDYVADAENEIKQLKSQLKEKYPKLTEEEEKLTTKKNALIDKGVKQSIDYNNGESYDLYILDTVLNPGYNSCWNDEFSKNTLSKEYCVLRNDVEDIEDKIESKEKYISSGRAENETKEKNQRLEQELEWEKSNDKFSIIPFIIFAIQGFMIPGMVSLMLFISAKRRNIMAFSAQQVMPVAQEGIEKMAPTVGAAAKEIAKGIKEGLKDEEK